MSDIFEYKFEKFLNTSLPLVVQKRQSPYYQKIHLHNAIELVYIRHGAGWCAVNGTIYPMFTGDLYVIPIGATHEYYSDANLNYVNCLFDATIFHADEMEIFNFFNTRNGQDLPDKYTFGPDLQPKIADYLDELDRELNSIHSFHLQFSRSIFIELLIFIIRHATIATGIKASHAQKQLGRVLSYINDNLDKKILQKSLAELSGYAPYYFGKLFRREIGCSVIEYICKCRLERAASELKNTSLTIDEIAVRTGFFDASYFIKVFKKHFDMTPYDFRYQIKQNCQTVVK